jgi:hypothetical protein
VSTERREAPWVTRAREAALPSHSRNLTDPDVAYVTMPTLHFAPRGTPLTNRIAARQEAGLAPTITVADLDQPFAGLTNAERYGLTMPSRRRGRRIFSLLTLARKAR